MKSARPPQTKIWLALLATITALSLAAAGPAYTLEQAVLVSTYAIAGLGLVLIHGQCGQITLGHGALMALGAYSQSIAVRAGLDAALALVLATTIAAAGGALVSLAARRLGGIYFAISTLALAMLTEELLRRADTLTNGASGLIVPAFAIGGYQADSVLARLAISLAALLLCWRICQRYIDSSTGRAWRAVREDETAAAFCGIDVAAEKMRVFLLGGATAGLAGALYAHWIGFVSPGQFGLALSFELFILVLIGGSKTPPAALWGALTLVCLPQLIELLPRYVPVLPTSAGLQKIIFGLLIILLVLYRSRAPAPTQTAVTKENDAKAK